MDYVRFESTAPNRRGVHVGIFALANDLAHSGRLTPTEWRWWRTNNDWFEAAYADPATVDPTLFDRTVHPVVTCWFKATAGHLLARVPGYLDLLDRHDVAWRESRSADPGTVLYEDPHQILVAPPTAAQPDRHSADTTAVTRRDVRSAAFDPAAAWQRVPRTPRGMVARRRRRCDREVCGGHVGRGRRADVPSTDRLDDHDGRSSSLATVHPGAQSPFTMRNSRPRKPRPFRAARRRRHTPPGAGPAYRPGR